METDIRPIDDADYRPLEPSMASRIDENPMHDDDDDRHREAQMPPQMFYPPSDMFMQAQQQSSNKQKFDLFGDLDKTAYIVIFVAFILGFFMGKTMQPVILRPG